MQPKKPYFSNVFRTFFIFLQENHWFFSFFIFCKIWAFRPGRCTIAFHKDKAIAQVASCVLCLSTHPRAPRVYAFVCIIFKHPHTGTLRFLLAVYCVLSHLVSLRPEMC